MTLVITKYVQKRVLSAIAPDTIVAEAALKDHSKKKKGYETVALKKNERSNQRGKIRRLTWELQIAQNIYSQ
jgi:hypothetical protein